MFILFLRKMKMHFRFLMENMPGCYYFEGEELDKHAVYFDALGKSKKQPPQILDSLYKIIGSFNPRSLKIKEDIREIDSALLCENIDHAFMVWEKYPWNKNTSFDDFCENILPYRIRNERLSNWRKEYYKLFSPYIDSLETDDPVIAAKHLRDAILKEKGKPRFTMKRPGGYPSLDAFNALYFNGSCDDLAQFTLFAFRSVGIPCTIDFISICGNYNLGLSWVSFKDKKGNHYAMDFFDEIGYISDKAHSRQLRKQKAYRMTFSNNIDAVNTMQKTRKEVPPTFMPSHYRFKDVTVLYSNNFTDKLYIPSSLLYHKAQSDKIVYLCGPSWMSWVPVDWTIPNKRGDIVFHNVNIGDIVRLATYDNGQFTFLTDPFKMDEQSRNVKTYATNDGKYENITLYSKYPIEGDITFRKGMVGGVFEGSNNASFHHADTLYVIKEIPYRLITEGSVPSDRKYRFVRYKGKAGSYCNVAEICFFSEDEPVRGKIIGTPGCRQKDGSHEYTNVFDGLTETSFDHSTPDEGWAGLDLGSARNITKIAYTPRNHDNYVKKGQRYELFVSSKSGWKSLGVQVAESDSLHYDHVPVGGLFYLKNHSSGRDERLFLMENGKQVFM